MYITIRRLHLCHVHLVLIQLSNSWITTYHLPPTSPFPAYSPVEEWRVVWFCGPPAQPSQLVWKRRGLWSGVLRCQADSLVFVQGSLWGTVTRRGGREHRTTHRPSRWKYIQAYRTHKRYREWRITNYTQWPSTGMHAEQYCRMSIDHSSARFCADSPISSVCVRVCVHVRACVCVCTTCSHNLLYSTLLHANV